MILTQQRQLSRTSVKKEDQVHGASDDKTQHLLDEIEHLKSELERRPESEEVSFVTTPRHTPYLVLDCRTRRKTQEK